MRVTEAFGNSSIDTATVAIRYAFSGFFQPVDNLPTINTVKAGRAVPVLFSLKGFHGLNIFAAGSPSVTFVPCGAGPTDAIEISLDLPGSFLIYNPFTDTYIYTWKTNRGVAWHLRRTAPHVPRRHHADRPLQVPQRRRVGTCMLELHAQHERPHRHGDAR